MLKLFRWCVCYLLSIGMTTVMAQETSFVNYDERLMLINELSGDRAYEQIRTLSQWHRASGSDGYFKAVEYVMQQAKSAGLEDVKFVEQDLGRAKYTPVSAELWVTSPVRVKLADMGDHSLFLADGSHSAELYNVDLVYIGDATDSAMAGIDVAGKIVLTNASPGRAVKKAVWELGALGVIAYPTSEGRSILDFPDQVALTTIPAKPPEGKKGTFAFIISPRKGEMLRDMLQTQKLKDYFRIGKKVAGGKILITAKVETQFEDDAVTGFVEGWIRGTRFEDQQIVLTAHLQEEQGSANDNGSGCTSILEIARTLNKLIAEGKIKQPLRDIRFWWTDEISSEYKYFSNNPDEPDNMLVNINQDMTGARQSLGSRTQHLIFAPHSVTSFLDALFESVGEYVIYSNNPFLTAGRMGGYSRPHAVEIYANRGSREGYGARFVPFFNASDNLNFVEGIIGVPSVALINWDDPYIHSTDDDLWQIDPTQIKRNAFIVAAMSFFLGKASKDDVPLLLSETMAQGSRRLANDLKAAGNEIHRLENAEEAYKNAHLLIEQGILREIRALNSVRIFCENDDDLYGFIDQNVQVLNKMKSDFYNTISLMYTMRFGKEAPAKLQLSPDELSADRKIPQNPDDIALYFKNRKKVKFKGKLHATMRFELYNFVDGRRSYFDIYKALKAENLAASRFLYGEVDLPDVVNMLDAAVEKQAFILK